MKKFIIFLLIFTLLACGCEKRVIHEEPSTTFNTTTSAVETTTSPIVIPDEPAVVLQADMFAVALPCTQTSITADNGNVVFSSSIQSLQLMMPDPDVANKVIIDFGSRQDRMHEAIASAENTARQNNSSGNKNNYFYHALYNHVRIDENVLSIAGTTIQNSGGIHPDYNCIYANYSMVTGDFLTLGSILTHADQANALCDLLIAEIEKVKVDYNIWDEYVETIRNRFSGDISNDSAWYFSNEGLCFSFSPYEIAPYSSRVFSVTVPYEKLTDIIEGEYFPVERDNASGTLIGQTLTEENAMLFSQTSEIILSETGTMILLSTDKALYDITIDVGQWNYGMFDKSYTALSRTALTPGDAIMLQAELPETDSPVCITYRAADQIHKYYITMVNGKVIFTPES